MTILSEVERNTHMVNLRKMFIPDTKKGKEFLDPYFFVSSRDS